MTKPSKIAAVLASVAVLSGAATLATAGTASARPSYCNPRVNDCFPDPPPPHGPPLPPPTTYRVVKAAASKTTNWHDYHQHTDATLYITRKVGTNEDLSAELDMTVRTWNDATFWGFHATTWVNTGPAYWISSKHTYGATPTIGGGSDVWDSPTQSVPVSTAEGISQLYINQALGGS